MTGKKSEEEDPDQPRKPEWSLLTRVAQAVAAYNSFDPDTIDPESGNRGQTGSGAALVAFFSSELRWRGGKEAGQKWTLSGSLNFEMIRQIVLGETFFLPRGYARLFYAKEEGRWRIGPFFQIQGGSSGMFVAQDTTLAKIATLTQFGAGVGGVAVWRPSQGLGLSALALLRYDSGGSPNYSSKSTGTFPSDISGGISWEAGFGVVTGLSERWYFEGRLRGLQESKKWTGTFGQGSLTDTYIIIDVGLGYRF
jgi:hypothetical protein